MAATLPTLAVASPSSSECAGSVTRPVPPLGTVTGGVTAAAQVPSPRQNVVLLAPVPEFRLVTGRLPDTSAPKATAPKVGAPAAAPCSTVVLVPSDPNTLGAPPAPAPNTMA